MLNWGLYCSGSQPTRIKTPGFVSPVCHAGHWLWKADSYYGESSRMDLLRGSSLEANVCRALYLTRLFSRPGPLHRGKRFLDAVHRDSLFRVGTKHPDSCGFCCLQYRGGISHSTHLASFPSQHESPSYREGPQPHLGAGVKRGTTQALLSTHSMSGSLYRCWEFELRFTWFHSKCS